MLDLCCLVKDHESQTGRMISPTLTVFYQSAPTLWSIDLYDRKPSLLLEVLKVQTEKKLIELTGCPSEDSEVRSFLQCLPHISQIR